MRAEWKIDEETQLIGIVARFDPMKDHTTFLRAAALLVQNRDDVRFVVVGEGNTGYQKQLRAQFDELIMTQKVIWAGARTDMAAVYNAMDILTSSSAYGEGFSNVLGEAMACGVPCVATDVGDAAVILGESGLVVPRENPEMMVAAWQEILSLTARQRRLLSEDTRERMTENFSNRALVQETSAALVRLL